MSFQELADRLGVTWVTAKKRYEDLRESGILFDPIANYDYLKLNLQRLNVIVMAPNYRALELLEMACDAHPFTSYRSRIIGDGFGLYIVFYVPEGSQVRDYMYLFFSKLNESYHCISSISYMVNRTRGITIYPDLTKFDIENKIWLFDWSDWFSMIDHNDNSTPKSLEDDVEQCDLNTIDKTNLMVLNRITRNAAIKQTDLMRDDSFNFSKTEAHRQYNFIMDNFITEVENIYDRRYFGVSDFKLFKIDFENLSSLNAFINHMNNNPPPFKVSIQLVESNTILIWIQMDQMSAQEFSFELFKLFPKTTTFDLIIHGTNSKKYYFYVDNFDDELKNWKMDYAWMIDHPFNVIDEYVKSNDLAI